MDSAPKDGTRILIWNEPPLVKNYGDLYKELRGWFIVAWIDDYVFYPGSKPVKRWCVPESFQDEQGGYFTIDYPLCWTHLPENPTLIK